MEAFCRHIQVQSHFPDRFSESLNEESSGGFCSGDEEGAERYDSEF